MQEMGCEAANVHLGTSKEVKNILKDLQSRKAKWLFAAGKRMAKVMKREWKEYQK